MKVCHAREKARQYRRKHKSGGAYGKSNGLSGFDGYISALEERQKRELEILAALPVRSLIISDPQNNWDAAYAEIEKSL